MIVEVLKLRCALARTLLDLAERWYLHAHGWRRVAGGWDSPPGYARPKVGVAQGHAINSMKQLDPAWREKTGRGWVS